MNCERCGRPLKTTLVRIKTRHGDITYGPKCAEEGRAVGAQAPQPRDRVAHQR